MRELLKQWMVLEVLFLRREICYAEYFWGNMDGAIYHPPTYFGNRYEEEWITDQLSAEMIKDIDQSEVISKRLIESPVLDPAVSGA